MSNDLVYYELGRGDIISKIRYKQWKFFRKLENMSPNQSATIGILLLRNIELLN